MTEGAADEEGSIGNNQILHRNRYSRAPCRVLNNIGFNNYRPDENLKNFAVYKAASRFDRRKCGGGFWFAFGLLGDYRGIKRVFTEPSLIGYRHNDGAITPIETTTTNAQTCYNSTAPGACEGEYEALAKGIAFYNGETIVRKWPGLSWPEILKDYDLETEPENQSDAGKRYATCYYSTRVRQKFGLPLRQYIWKGGDSGGSQDVNGDGTIADIGIPGEEDFVQETDLPDVPWCFAFGEEEWVIGVEFEVARE